VSDVFAKLSQYPLTVDDEDLQIREKFVVIMYDRSSTAEGVDDARLCLLESRDHMKQSHELEELCCSTPNVLPIRQAASGVNQQCVAVNVTFKHVVSLHWFAMHNREAETDQ